MPFLEFNYSWTANKQAKLTRCPPAGFPPPWSVLAMLENTVVTKKPGSFVKAEHVLDGIQNGRVGIFVAK